VLYVGGGIISAGAAAQLRIFAETLQIPVTTTLMGCGAFPEDHPLSLRWLGMHGAAAANWAVSGEYQLRSSPDMPTKLLHPGADLLLAFGVRFDDRVTGKVDQFCELGKIVHIDVDPAELNKNKKVHLAMNAELKHSLTRLNELIAGGIGEINREVWLNQIAQWKEKAPFGYRVSSQHLSSLHLSQAEMQEDHIILPQMAIEALYDLSQGQAIIATGVGQHQMWAAQFYKFTHPRKLLTSGGLGTMGFGLPAALGAKLAYPDR